MKIPGALKKYWLVLLVLSALLIVTGDHLQFGSSKRPPERSESSTEEPLFHLNEGDAHSDPEKNRRMGIFHFNEGNKALRKEKWQEAIKNYRMALRHNSKFQETYVNLSTTYLRTGNYEKAYATLKSLETINAANPFLHYNLACYYSLTGKTGPSLDSLKKAVQFGYKNFREIEKDPDLEALRRKEAFKKWLAAARQP
ncbi:MAG: tetratricopeptide repeat protein [Nitrospinaceae bacterium]